jgi:hypothetical protein
MPLTVWMLDSFSKPQFLYIYIVILEFELRASPLLGRYPTIWAVSPPTLFVLVAFLGRVSHFLPVASLRPWSSYLRLSHSWNYRCASPRQALINFLNEWITCENAMKTFMKWRQIWIVYVPNVYGRGNIVWFTALLHFPRHIILFSGAGVAWPAGRWTGSIPPPGVAIRLLTLPFLFCGDLESPEGKWPLHRLGEACGPESPLGGEPRDRSRASWPPSPSKQILKRIFLLPLTYNCTLFSVPYIHYKYYKMYP